MPTLSQAQEACSLIGRAQLAARECMVAGKLAQALWWMHEVKAEADNGRDVLRALIEQRKAVGDEHEGND